MDTHHNDTKQETDERAEQTPEQQLALTPAGIGAMQGFEIQSGVEKPALSENQVEMLTLQERHRLGIKYALENAEVEKDGIVAYRKLCGAVGEGVHLSANGASIGLVNDLNERLGNHSKVFDGSSSQELASLKTYVTGRGDPSARYARALREMVGQVEPQKLDALARELWTMKQDEPEKWATIRTQLPSGLNSAADLQSLKTSLADDAVMRVPEDHVAGARAHVIRNAVRANMRGSRPSVAVWRRAPRRLSVTLANCGVPRTACESAWEMR